MKCITQAGPLNLQAVFVGDGSTIESYPMVVGSKVLVEG